jgi:hypothetical protein
MDAPLENLMGIFSCDGGGILEAPIGVIGLGGPLKKLGG